MHGFGGYGTAAVCRRQCAPRRAGTETGAGDFSTALAAAGIEEQAEHAWLDALNKINPNLKLF
jgi:hypothetical protein